LSTRRLLSLQQRENIIRNPVSLDETRSRKEPRI
jgi:hypothetical protein